ncbi:Hypothetical protein CINCED_3A009571 [Cinara cedri]|uniref:Uncharacterized protein n=1 Tax=Cinara cedri TaxID=506608 RepID=A0A5E4NTF6_9HEMI|nr:Hypothetical protein CINCED_3A009571 [Cinara cedri]
MTRFSRAFKRHRRSGEEVVSHANAVSIRDEQASKTRSDRNASITGGLSGPAMTAWTFAGSFWSQRSVSWRVFPERWNTDIRNGGGIAIDDGRAGRLSHCDEGGCDRIKTSRSPIWRVTPKHEV